MPRITGTLAGVLLPVLAVAALSGCSASSKDGSGDSGTSTAAGAHASGKPGAATGGDSGGDAQSKGGVHGRIDYTGSANGGFDVTMSVACATAGGKLTAVTAPAPDDTDQGTVPSFVAAGIDTEGMATLVTKDKKTFVKLGADGLSAEQHNGVWTVTLSGTELGATDTSGGAVTVNGTLVCTKVSGT